MPKKNEPKHPKHPKHMTTKEAVEHLFHPQVLEHAHRKIEEVQKPKKTNT
jgi:hypothetical protein